MINNWLERMCIGAAMICLSTISLEAQTIKNYINVRGGNTIIVENDTLWVETRFDVHLFDTSGRHLGNVGAESGLPSFPSLFRNDDGAVEIVGMIRENGKFRAREDYGLIKYKEQDAILWRELRFRKEPDSLMIRYRGESHFYSNEKVSKPDGIIVDKQQNFWTWSKYGSGDNIFYLSKDTIKSFLVGKYLEAVFIDKKERPWAFDSKGAVFNFEDGQWKPSSLFDFNPQFVLRDQDGIVWLVSDQQNRKLYRFNGENIETIELPVDPESKFPRQVSALTTDKYGHIWFVTDFPGGIMRYQPKTKEWTVFPINNPYPIDNSVSMLFAAENGELWASDMYATFQFKGDSLYNHFKNGTSMKLNTSNGSFSADKIVEDSKGRLWTYATSGLFCYENGAWKNFVNFKKIEDIEFIGDKLYVLFRKEGKVWVIDKEDNISVISISKDLSQYNCTLFGDAKGQLWVLCDPYSDTRSLMLLRYDGTKFDDTFETNNPFATDNHVRIDQFLSDNLGRIWLRDNHKIVYLNPGSDKWTDLSTELSSANISNLFLDSAGNINCWDGANLLQHDGKRWSFNLYSSELLKDIKGVEQTIIDQKGRLWIYTYKELFCMDGQKLTKMPVNARITDIIEDENGRIWFSGQYLGLFSIDY